MNFATTKADAIIIAQIAGRAHKEIFIPENGWEEADQSFLDTTMDVTACHANGCPLDLQKLLGADDITFAHDITGIRRHISRSTGAMQNCFLPRCAAQGVAA